MKYLMSVLCCFFAMITQSAQFATKVSVHSHNDVVALYQMGLRIDDAKVRERTHPDGSKRYQVRFNPENGFVTVISEAAGVELIRNRGFHISSSYELPGNVTHSTQRPLLDTIPYQFGWPRTIFNGLSLYENSPTVADIDKNGQLDLSVTNAWGSYSPVNPPYLITWRRNGAYLSGFPVPLEPGQVQSSADAGISAAADIYGDEKLELVCGDENGFLYFSFPVDREMSF